MFFTIRIFTSNSRGTFMIIKAFVLCKPPVGACILFNNKRIEK